MAAIAGGEGASMRVSLRDIVLFSCLLACVTGMVIAVASSASAQSVRGRVIGVIEFILLAHRRGHAHLGVGETR